MNCLIPNSDDDIIKLLTLLKSKGESVNEITGFAKALQKASTPINLNKPSIDICGTGGSGKDRFNVSTASAFILAALGIPVSKHGNRGSTKANGSFDFLEALQVNFNHNAETLSKLFEKTNICFIFARLFHPSLAKIGPARKKFGSSSIFNYLGPLCNPSNPSYQIIGTHSKKIAIKLANAKQLLKTEKSLIITGHNELDELSTTGPSSIIEVTKNNIDTYEFNPSKLGIQTHNEKEISGNTATENAILFESLFEQRSIKHPIAQLICLNSAAALYCIGHAQTIEDGFKLAQTTLQSGKAWEHFLYYKTTVNTDNPL